MGANTLSALLCLNLLIPVHLVGQEFESGGLSLFVDCKDCVDIDYLRTRLSFVRHVREVVDADVILLMSSREGPAGGRRYILFFQGTRSLHGLADTLFFDRNLTDTNDDARRGVADLVTLGLARYLARLPSTRGASLVLSRPPTTDQVASRDAWDGWVFSATGAGSISGERSLSSLTYSGAFSADKVTDDLRLHLSVDASYSRSVFRLDDTTEFRSALRGYGASAVLGTRIGGRWSAAATVRALSSDYLNYALNLRAAPVLEFAILPYEGYVAHSLAIAYSVGANFSRYQEKTIFAQTREALLDHAVDLVFQANKPWGNALASIQGSQYLRDLDKRRLQVSGSLAVRVVRGVAITASMNYAVIHDQLFLPAGNATEEELLLRRRQLATSYHYFGALGFQVTFGSATQPTFSPRLNRAGELHRF